MATPVTLPALGESVTEGTVTRWLKQPGDQVEVDEPLLEVSTDKVDTEIPSPVAGTLIEIKVSEDETVEVGAELCTVGDEGESGDSGGDEDQADAEESDGGESDAGSDAGSDAEEDTDETSDEAAADEDTSTGAGEGAGGDPKEQAAPSDKEVDRQTEPQGDVPQAETAETPPAQETSVASSDTKPERKSSEEGTKTGGGGSPVTLPALGESVTEGTVTRWLKQVGDDVAVDEALLEVSTDKVDTEIPSPVAGKLLEIKVDEDETVEVGAELAMIGSEEAASTDDGEPESDESSGDESGGGESEGGAEPAPESEDKAGDAEEEAESDDEDEAESDDEDEAESDDEEPAKKESAKAEPKEAPAKQPAPQQEAAEKEADTDVSVPSTSASGSSDGEKGAYVTPLVRKMAAEQGVDLSSVEGTGVGGRIRKQDVLDAAKAQKAGKEQPAAASADSGGTPAPAAPAAPSPLRGKTEPLSRLRKVIAKRMVESLQTSAQLTTVLEVDVTSISRLRDSVKEEFANREGVKLSFMPFFAKAAIDALKAHPSLNAAIDTEKGEVTYYDHENLAIAVDTEKGLLTPVIKDAGDLSVAGLARKIADIADRTRKNKIGPDELSGGTFTLTNTGSRGALFDTPIINQPQVAILGTGSVVKRAVVIDDANLGETIAVRRMMYLALTYDHRLVDGADAARFLSEVKARREAGQFEV